MAEVKGGTKVSAEAKAKAKAKVPAKAKAKAKSLAPTGMGEMAKLMNAKVKAR
jgi:hypothetical protein